jgi:hypothetical protein
VRRRRAALQPINRNDFTTRYRQLQRLVRRLAERGELSASLRYYGLDAFMSGGSAPSEMCARPSPQPRCSTT